jgi:hypothetical protein
MAQSQKLILIVLDCRGGFARCKPAQKILLGGNTMKKFTIILLAAALVAGVAHAEKPAWQKGDQILSRGALDCTGAITLENGVIVSGDNSAGTDVVDLYTPYGFDHEYGPEVVYAVDLPAGCQEITGEISNMSADLDIYFLSSCDETTSIAFGDNIVTFPYTGGDTGETIYVVVDGYNDTDISTFDLVVSWVPGITEPCDTAVTAVEGLNSCPGAPYWYTFTAPIDGCIWIDSCIPGQTTDTLMMVLFDCCGALIDYNDDSYDCPEGTDFASFLSVPVTAGDVLYIFWNPYWTTDPFDFNLYVTDCTVATDEMSWGSIKSLYR